MADYTDWRDIEREFRELGREQPAMRAIESPDGWTVPTNGANRFRALAGIAVLNATGQSSTWTSWLDLLKAWLLETGSDSIDCSHVTSAGGIEAKIPGAAKSIYHQKWPKIQEDDERLNRYTLCTIRSVCVASADYCLEHARASLRLRARPKSAVPPPQDQSREERLQGFIKEKGCTIAAVCRSAGVVKSNMQQWRKEKLSDDSVMSERIEDVLSGKRPLKG